MEKFKQTYLITGSDIDLNYRMIPMSAVAYFEDCFARYAASKFLAAFDVESKGLYWVISEIDISFETDLPFWSENFQVELWISEKTKVKTYCDFVMKFKGQIFAKGSSCWVILNKNRNRPAGTDILDGKMDVHNELVFGEHRKILWKDSDRVLNTLEHQVSMADIDFNRHVNNKTYLKLAVACHSETYGFENAIKSLKVKFGQECFLGDKLVCMEYDFGDNTCGYKIQKQGINICDIIIEWETLKKKISILEIPLSVRES